MRRRPSGRTVPAVLALAVVLLAGTPLARATLYCENITGNHTIVGEARYETFSWEGPDIAYANAYWDGGAELALPQGGGIGGASSAATDLRFYIYGLHQDFDSVSCSTVSFEIKLDRSNGEDANHCPTGYSSSTATLVIDSCPTLADRVFGGKAVGLAGLAYRRHWKATVTTDGDVSASDSGCWEVYDQNDCTLQDF